MNLTDIRARLKAATPGPWRVGEKSRNVIQGIKILFLPTCWTRKKADVEFLANAPTDIAALLAEVERLTADKERLKEALDIFGRHNCQQWNGVCDCGFDAAKAA